MPRMREVGRRQVRPGPSAAHEWEPSLGSATLGPWPVSKRRPHGAAGVVPSAATQGGSVNHRRLVGIDLGITSAHTVRVLDASGTILAKRKAWPTAQSLSAVEAVALAGVPEGTRL